MTHEFGKDIPKDAVAQIRSLKMKLRESLANVDRLRGYKQYLITRLTQQEDDCAAEIEKIQKQLDEFTSKKK